MDDIGARLPKTWKEIELGIQERLHLGAQIYVSLHGETVVDAALGEAVAGVPFQTNTLMLWFSAGKPVTAIAIAQMVELNLVGLDEPVRTYIPEFGQKGKEAITVRHILMHTGGFRGADLILNHLQWDETVRGICATPLEKDWTPGKKAGYHLQGSWFVLGEIVQRISRERISQYVQKRIFEPLTMSDSWLGMTKDSFREYGNRIAVLYKTEDGGLVPHPVWRRESSWTEPNPGSNTCGPVRELGRFYESLLGIGPGRILRSATVELFTRRHRAGLYDHTFQHVIDFGLGFIVDSNRYGVETVPYGYGRYCSEQTFGHSGAQCSCAFADPKHGLVVAWGCNGMPGEPKHQRRARQINSAIYEDMGLAK